MERLAELPGDMVFFTQITMEAAEDPLFLDAMRKARIKGALVGVEAVTAEGLKAVYKDFNCSGDDLVTQLKTLSATTACTCWARLFSDCPRIARIRFEATLQLAQKVGADVRSVRDADAVCRHRGFRALGKIVWRGCAAGDGTPITRYWLIPRESRPKMFMPHPTMSSEEMRAADARCVGSSSTAWSDLETVAVRFLAGGAAGVCFHFEAVPADVCEHRYIHRQRAPQPRERTGRAGWRSRAANYFTGVRCPICRFPQVLRHGSM